MHITNDGNPRILVVSCKFWWISDETRHDNVNISWLTIEWLPAEERAELGKMVSAAVEWITLSRSLALSLSAPAGGNFSPFRSLMKATGTAGVFSCYTKCITLTGTLPSHQKGVQVVLLSKWVPLFEFQCILSILQGCLLPVHEHPTEGHADWRWTGGRKRTSTKERGGREDCYRLDTKNAWPRRGVHIKDKSTQHCWVRNYPGDSRLNYT